MLGIFVKNNFRTAAIRLEDERFTQVQTVVQQTQKTRSFKYWETIFLGVAQCQFFLSTKVKLN